MNADDRVLDTYRFLRGGLVVMVVMLFASLIVVAITTDGCWQTSISAYYYTAAHSVFVASLCALGILLITYRGSNDTEDILLDLAGVLAFVVAMVPTARPANNAVLNSEAQPPKRCWFTVRDMRRDNEPARCLYFQAPLSSRRKANVLRRPLFVRR